MYFTSFLENSVFSCSQATFNSGAGEQLTCFIGTAVSLPSHLSLSTIWPHLPVAPNQGMCCQLQTTVQHA
jgi:hypothetical protein